MNVADSFPSATAWRPPSRPGQRVDADEHHLPVAPLGLGGEERAHRHRDRCARRRDRSSRAPRAPTPSAPSPPRAASWRPGRGRSWMPGDPAIASRKPSLRSRAGGEPGRPLISTISPWPFEDLHDELAGGLADLAVVGADEGRVRVALDRAVEHDHRDALLVDPAHDRRQRLRLVRRDDQEVDLLAQEVLDVGDLLGVVLLRVGVGDLDVGEALRRRRHVRVHRHAPRLAQVALREADQVLAGLRLAATGRPGRSRRPRGRPQGPPLRPSGPGTRAEPVGPRRRGGALPPPRSGHAISSAAGARPRRG